MKHIKDFELSTGNNSRSQFMLAKTTTLCMYLDTLSIVQRTGIVEIGIHWVNEQILVLGRKIAWVLEFGML